MEQGIFIDPHLIWNLFLTLVLLPVGFFVRSALNEQKRIDILLNKTREELAKEYVSKDEFQQAMDRLMISIERIDEKLDRLQSRTYFQE
jgi:hypothetical protein|tara:strand:- start:148 stop:414 length:267 start_codon:yes stop_codon:yes gene_type:complete